MELHALEPRGAATTELVRLAEREQELRAHVDEIGRAARAAGAELADAREALAELERRAATEQVSTQARRKAEDRLTRAEQEAAAPWPQRRDGAERAARDGRHEIQRHVAEHFAEIVSELEEIGAAAAEQVDHAAEAFLAATARRAEAERRLISVVALTRSMGPNDVTRARSDEAVHAVSAFVQRGGEDAPVLRIVEPVSA
jgi:chromosome segregation ATPase